VGGALLAGGIAAAGVLTYASQVEPLDIRLERLPVRLPAAAGRLPAHGLRILQLSDSHFYGGKRTRREQAKIARVRALTAGLEYDLLIHTGDFIHFDSGLENVLRLLDAAPRPRLGAFGVFGNHDYTHYAMEEALPRMWRTFCAQERARNQQRSLPARLGAAATHWLRYVHYVRNTPLDGRRTGSNDAGRLNTALEQWGMTMLHNRATHLHHPELGLDIYLAGVDDVIEGRPRLGDSIRDIPAGAPLKDGLEQRVVPGLANVLHLANGTVNHQTGHEVTSGSLWRQTPQRGNVVLAEQEEHAVGVDHADGAGIVAPVVNPFRPFFFAALEVCGPGIRAHADAGVGQQFPGRLDGSAGAWVEGDDIDARHGDADRLIQVPAGVGRGDGAGLRVTVDGEHGRPPGAAERAAHPLRERGGGSKEDVWLGFANGRCERCACVEELASGGAIQPQHACPVLPQQRRR
jgi:predicted MPP superfamily phosphohydrolase